MAFAPGMDDGVGLVGVIVVSDQDLVGGVGIVAVRKETNGAAAFL